MNDKKENSLKVTEEAKKGLLDILSDCPSIIKVGDNDYKIRPLRVYSIRMLSKLASELKDTKGDPSEVFKAMGENIDIACKSIAILINNHKFTSDWDKNEEMIEETAHEVQTELTSWEEWSKLFYDKLLPSCNIESFFQFTAYLPIISELVVRRKGITQLQYQQGL